MSSFESRLMSKLTIRWRREWKAFLVCFALAGFLWFFQSMGRDHLSDIEVDIVYENLPEDMAFTEALPDRFHLDVKGQGWDLLAYKWRVNKAEYHIDLSQYASDATFSANAVRDMISQNIPGLKEILNISPTSIDLHLEKAHRKKLPVKPQVSVDPKKGYALSGKIIVEPDSVWVRGPKSRVDQLEFINTESYTEKEAHEKVEVELKLSDSLDFIFMEPQSVTVSFEVEKLTEKEMQIPIRVKGYRGTRKVSLVPQIATVKFQITLGNFNKVDEEDIDVFVEFPEDQSDEEMLDVQVSTSSPLLNNLKVRPNQVDFILE